MLVIRVFIFVVMASCLQAQSIITTVAGRGRILKGSGSALSVPLAGPRGLAFDSKGNLYIADNQQDVVFRALPDGTISVFAGSGVRGYSGDGGPATAAAMVEPGAVTVDAADNVYIADFHNERIRKVDQKGVITTFAGGGAAYEVDEIPATASGLFEPTGLAFDQSGSLYFAEEGTCSIRRITPDGIIHRVMGGGHQCGFTGDGGPAANARIQYPLGIAFDGKGNLYIADTDNKRIRKIDTSGNISTVAGTGAGGNNGDGGPAVSASLAFPADVAIDAAGNLFIADSGISAIRKVTPSGTITTLAGNSAIWPPTYSGDGEQATAASLDHPFGLAFDPAGNLHFSDQNNRRVRRITSSGIISTVAGNGVANFSGDDGPAVQAAMDFPTDVEVDSLGNLYIADAMNHRVRKVTPAGTITTIAGTGVAGFSGDGGAAVSAQLHTPVSVAIDSSGNVYIADAYNRRIRRVTPAGSISTYAGNGSGNNFQDGVQATSTSIGIPGGIAIDDAGTLYIAGDNRILKVTAAGIVSTIAGNGISGYSGDGGPAKSATLAIPNHIAADKAGNLFVTDMSNGAVRKITPDGTISTIAGGVPGAVYTNLEGASAASGQTFLDNPDGIAVDGQGNVYFEAGWHLYRVNASGTITLLAGAGMNGYQEGFDGDGGPSVAAHISRDSVSMGFAAAMGMAVDGAGNLYFADTGNDRIRKISHVDSPTQLTITTPDNFTLHPPTGGDQTGLTFFRTGSQRLSISNAGSGPMLWTATSSTLDGGNWLQISSGSGDAPSTIAVSADATNLSPGLYRGTILITTADANNSPRYFSVRLNVPIPTINKGGTSQTFVVNEPAGVGWSASANVDWITITSEATGYGAGSFTWSVAANPGTTLRSGVLNVGGVAFNVTQPANGPVIQTIVDSWNYTPGIAPGAWVTITGVDLTAVAPQTWNLNGTQQLPTTLGGTTVTFNGMTAALLYVSATQINALVPASVSPGTVRVIVRAYGMNSNTITTTATATLPSIYALPTADGSTFFVTAVLAGTSTLIGNSAVDTRVARAALPGDILDLYMVGLGATLDPAGFVTNQIFQGAYAVSSAVTAMIGGKAAQVLFAGLTSPGLYLVRVTVPLDVLPGAQPIQINAGAGQTRPSVVLLVGSR